MARFRYTRRGRYKKYGLETVAKRVPACLESKIDEMISDFIKENKIHVGRPKNLKFNSKMEALAWRADVQRGVNG